MSEDCEKNSDKKDPKYNPAGNTKEKSDDDTSGKKNDEYGKRKKNADGGKKANPSS